MRPDAVVVGAGIIGAACADALSAAGLRVTVLESEFAASGTSSRGMGHVLLMDANEAEFALTRRSRDLWTALAPELPPSCQDAGCGTLWLAADEEEMAVARRRESFLRARGVSAQILDPGELARAEPRLRPGLLGALYIPEDRVLYPPAADRFLLARAASRGATLLEGTEALELGPRRVRTRDGWIDAALVVVAAGLASRKLVPALPLEPRKGHLLITDRAPGLVKHAVLDLAYIKTAHTHTKESVTFCLEPRRTGQLLVGSSREFVGLDASINLPLRNRMARRALEFVPSLAQVPVLRTWVGFRPCSPDNLPFIGRWEPLEGVLLATGHEGIGITSAPATGEIVADLALGRRGAVDPAPFSPMRLAASGGGEPLGAGPGP